MTNPNRDLTPEQIRQQLRHFTGTTAYYRFSPLYRNFVLTDGTKFVAETCQAFWLFDLIASHQLNPAVRDHPRLQDGALQFWTLAVNDASAVAVCEWDTGEEVARQEIEYTDFPLPEIKIYVAESVLEGGKRVKVALLPSEY
jgi:hypothetical protein